MATLTTRTLDWIDQAPIALHASAVSTASALQVFEVLADHERWPDWFPNVKEVVVTGERAGVGATRRVRIPGAAIDEVFIAWEPGERWSFTGTASSRPIIRSLVEDCRLEPTASGGCTIRYSMYLEPARWASPLVRLASGNVRSSLQKGVTRLAERAS